MRTSLGFVAVLLLGLLSSGGGALLDDSSADAQLVGTETRTVVLDAGWNLAGWTGPPMPFADAIADILEVTQAAAAFDAGPQVFRSWNATAPTFLNTLTTLRQGEALWVQVTAPIEWVQPVVPDAAPLTLARGFNLVTWTGQSGTLPAAGFAGLGTDLDAAFGFDPGTSTFASFGPSRPAFINDLPPLRYGAGVWLWMNVATGWRQPSPSPPAQITAPQTGATLEIPRGALPPGIDPGAIGLSLQALDPESVIGAEPGPLFRLEPDGLEFPVPVTLMARLAADRPSDRVEFVLVAAGEGGTAVRVIGAVKTERDPETGELVASIPLTHFSDVYSIYVRSVFRVDAAAPPLVLMGDPFDVRWTVTRTVEPTADPLDGELLYALEVAAVPGSKFYRYLSPTPWTVIGWAEADGPVVPREVANKPAPTDVSEGTFTTGQRFTCTGVGPLTLYYDAEVTYSVASLFVAPDFDDGRPGGGLPATPQLTTEKLFDRTVVTCMVPRIVATVVPPRTTYSVDVPNSADTFFSWSGADCGSVTGSTTSTMVWNHGGTGCSHAGAGHPTTAISLLLRSGDVEYRCTYLLGAGSGSGPPCELGG